MKNTVYSQLFAVAHVGTNTDVFKFANINIFTLPLQKNVITNKFSLCTVTLMEIGHLRYWHTYWRLSLLYDNGGGTMWHQRISNLMQQIAFTDKLEKAKLAWHEMYIGRSGDIEYLWQQQ